MSYAIHIYPHKYAHSCIDGTVTKQPSVSAPPLINAARAASIQEAQRALDLNTLLGPKAPPLDHHEITAEDVETEASKGFIIDLHSSNSNVGLVGMISGIKVDVTAARLSHHLQSKFHNMRFTSSPGSKAESYSVDAISGSGMAIEVGPVVHGTVSEELLEDTKQLVRHIAVHVRYCMYSIGYTSTLCSLHCLLTRILLRIILTFILLYTV